MPRTPEPVLGSLRLRQWALGVLSSAEPPPAPPPASPAAWALFLRVEQCALPLAARYSEDAPIPSPLLRDRARSDSRRVLAARMQLRRLGALARDRGLRLAALKGGAALLCGGPELPMMDVDVMASPEGARSLADALDAAGHRVHGRAAAHRLAVRATEGELPVEIHTAAPGIPAGAVDRAVAVPGAPLLVLHPADHLHYLVVHSVVQHEDRRGRIRDLVLVADALGRCAPEDLRRVHEAVAREPQAAALAGQIAQARALGERRGPAPDPFELMAAGRFLLAHRLDRWKLKNTAREFAWTAGCAAVAARSGSHQVGGTVSLDLPSAHRSLAWIRRRTPAAERAVRLLARRGKDWLLRPLGAAVAAGTERALRERAAEG
jgi:hypothetical protein